jgi:Flp pilus assembly protein TadB
MPKVYNNNNLYVHNQLFHFFWWPMQTKEMRRKSQASLTGYNMHSKEKKSRRAESDSDQQHPSSTNNKMKSRSKNKIKRSISNSDAAEKRVTVMVACMVGAFMAAWTPYSILALFETFIGVATLPADQAGTCRTRR